MANVRDSDTSLWLHNKLGTSNDSWTSGSICSQLNKEVLRNIKDCFPDLQTQVKLKLLLSFFHIPRRLVEEWKTELEEIIEIAGLDSELWVSMIAEMIKTFPSTGSLNTEISDYEETRPIFTDMVNDLRKLINKHSDSNMLPLECQYLNKAALVSVVGQQPSPVKHFTLKKKPKSVAIRAELMQKCSDAQSIKKTSAPTIPLRSRGMPRKMTDTTPLKGIPSRVPSSGFRTPSCTQSQSRPNMSRTPAGRKDGGIKLLDITEQPLGYAAAKKRKRQQELEDQQKRALEAQNSQPAKQESPAPVTTTPDYAAGLNATPLFTPAPVTTTTATTTTTTTVIKEATITTPIPAAPTTIQFVKSEQVVKSESIIVKNESVTSMSVDESPVNTTTIYSNASLPPSNASNVTSTINNNQIIFSMKPTSTAISATSNSVTQSPISQTVTIKQEPRIITIPQSASTIITTSQKKQQPVLLQTPQSLTVTSQPILSSAATYLTPTLSSYSNNNTINTTTIKPQINVQSVISSMPSLTALSSSNTTVQHHQQHQQQHVIQQQNQQHQQTHQAQQHQQILQHTTSTVQQPQTMQIPQQIGATKIVQIKTAPTIQMISSNTQRASHQNIPPLIPTQQPTILNIRNVSITGRQSTANQIHTSNPSTISYITTSQHQQQQQQQVQQQVIQQQQQQQQQPQQVQVQSQQIIQQPQTSTIQVQSTPKYSQVVMSPSVKGNTIILSNPNVQTQKTIILRTVGPDGKATYQQVPISNVSGLNIGGTANNMTILTGPPGLIKATGGASQVQHQTVQQQQQQTATQQIPALVPTSNFSQTSSVQPMVITSTNQQSLPTLITSIQTQHQQQQQQQVQQQQNQQTQTILLQSSQSQQQPQPGTTIIRPVLVTNQQGVNMLPQGLTLIQRPGQQPQLVQTIQQAQQPQQIHRTIITQSAQPQQQQIPQQIGQVQIRPAQQQPQQIIIQQQQPTIITQPQQQQKQGQPEQRIGLSLCSEYAHKAHEMFRRANCVTRRDKALILSFMAGCRENPVPSADNCIVIKLGDTEEKVKQGDDHAIMQVESFIKLDYNTGEWKKFQNFKRIVEQQQPLEQ